MLDLLAIDGPVSLRIPLHGIDTERALPRARIGQGIVQQDTIRVEGNDAPVHGSALSSQQPPRIRSKFLLAKNVTIVNAAAFSRTLEIAIKVPVWANGFQIDQLDCIIDGIAQQVELALATEFMD